MRRALWTVMLLAGVSCVRSARPDAAPPLSVSEISARIPAKVADREGWARDLALALEIDGLPADEAHVCAVIAVVDQESGFQANPAVQGLAGIARKELGTKAAALGPLGQPVLAQVLSAKAPGAKLTFDERLSTVRTEA